MKMNAFYLKKNDILWSKRVSRNLLVTVSRQFYDFPLTSLLLEKNQGNQDIRLGIDEEKWKLDDTGHRTTRTRYF